MTNLPITTGAAKATAATKQTAGTADAGDGQKTSPFVDVLARQINEPLATDAKATDKPGIDALAQLGTDTKVGKQDAADTKKSDTVVPPDCTATLPADMLAALLPQAMNVASSPVTTNTKPDTAAITAASSTQDKRGIAPLQTDIATNAKTDINTKAGIAPASTSEANPGPQPKEQSFAAALTESANRTPGAMELNKSARETIAATAAPHSSAAELAALQNTAANLAAPVIQPVQVTINAPVTQGRWADEFSQKITWLASSNKDQTAELHLNPPQLGPLDVVIKVSGDQATALFTSPHAAVRDAIEQAMPKLRDMLADNGIMLGNATVSDQAPRDQGQSGSQRLTAPASNEIREIPMTGNSASRISQISRHNGIVDTFA